MKYVITCEKLVRDRIPDLIADTESTIVVETLDRKSHILALKKKLKEEADEVAKAQSREQIIEELADLSEVMDALVLMLSIDRHEIDHVKRAKSLKNGGFDRGLFLKTIETKAGSAIAQYFQKDQAANSSQQV